MSKSAIKKLPLILFLIIFCLPRTYAAPASLSGQQSQPGCSLLQGIDINPQQSFREFEKITYVSSYLYVAVAIWVDGLGENEVMILAGHASFDTTRRFYMAVRKDIIERARKASAKAMQGIFVAQALRAPV